MLKNCSEEDTSLDKKQGGINNKLSNNGLNKSHFKLIHLQVPISSQQNLGIPKKPYDALAHLQEVSYELTQAMAERPIETSNRLLSNPWMNIFFQTVR